MVHRVGDSRAGEPSRDTAKGPRRARHRAGTRNSDHRAGHTQASVPPSGGQGNSPAENGDPSVSPAHEPQRRKARRLRHSGGEQSPRQRVVAGEQSGTLEKPRRVPAGEIFGGGIEGRSQWERFQVPSFRRGKEELSRDYSGSPNFGNHIGAFGSEL